MMQQLPHFPENHSTAAMASADMTVPEWQRARLKWLQQQQQQYQSFFTAAPTALDLGPHTFSVLPAGTATPFHTYNAFCDEEGSSVAHDLLSSMSPDLIHCPIFGSSFVSGGEGSVVEGGDEPGMSRFCCQPVGGEEEMKATPSVAASPFDVRGGAAVAAAAPYYSKVDGGRESSRKRKAAQEAITEEAEDDGMVEKIDGGGYYIDAMIVPKLETDPPISSVTTTTTTANGSDGKPTGTNKEATSGTSREKCTKASDPAAKTGYIHVRARRGQATDSHSLAERARREKISKRMKLLQDLVPGCSRITGKAGVLDEIINYVQSLQRQVEFLSMKLASVNPILDSNIDAFFSKEVVQMIPHHGGVLPSSAGTLPLAPLDGSFLNHVNTTQTQQAVAAPTAVHCSSSLNNKVAVSSSCPGEQTLLLHPTPRAPVAVSEGCLVMDPYKDVHVLAATSLWEADLHAHYSVYE